MAYDYTMSVDNVQYYSQLNGCEKVIKQVEWTILIFDTSEPDITQTNSILTEFDTDDISPDNFTPWTDLTHTQILTWCLAKVGGEAFVQNLMSNTEIQELLRYQIVRASLLEADLSEISES